jgi:RNA polymerase sigma factor (sigma-70 family)
VSIEHTVCSIRRTNADRQRVTGSAKNLGLSPEEGSPNVRQVCAQLPGSGSVATMGARLGDALRAWCGPLAWLTTDVPPREEPALAVSVPDADRLVADLFRAEGRSLVRLARLFVDDRNAAEDLVQEAFIRLSRNVHRIQDRARAPAYLRSIVLNLARDQNRRGLVSLRHRLPLHDIDRGIEDQIDVGEDQREVLDALRELPTQQRACLVLRYYDELGPDDIAATLGISRNSVKTHLQRGLAALESRLVYRAAS